MKRKRLSAGEIRFRISKIDLERIDWLIKNHPDEHDTVSALLRSLISKEVERLKTQSGLLNDLIGD